MGVGAHRDSAELVRSQREQSETWARAFTVVSVGKNEGSRVNRVKIGWSE